MLSFFYKVFNSGKISVVVRAFELQERCLELGGRKYEGYDCRVKGCITSF